MSLPQLDIHLDIIRKNAATVRKLCEEYGIEVTGVTKAFTAQPQIAQAFLDSGISRLGDSRIQNLKKLEGLQVEKWLIRMPMLSEIDETVTYADVSLNSELATIKALDHAAGRLGRTHKIILMADLGDLREGYVVDKELLSAAEEITKLRHVRLYGVGTNLSCFSFIRPDNEKMSQLQALAARLPLEGPPIISGGNSATLHLMMEGGLSEGINNLRLGESLLFGKERCYYSFLQGTRRDAFILSAEVIELKEKPSLPWGEVGTDSYGRYPSKPTDRGIRKKAILALGKQDCDSETMQPLDRGIQLLGASSDHMMLDVTDSQRDYRVGDWVEFELGYYSLMRAFTSEYVQKSYCELQPNAKSKEVAMAAL